MSDQAAGRDEARAQVRHSVNALGWTKADLSRRARVDIGTVSDFLDGDRWPQASTRLKLEEALGWPPGAIAAIAEGRSIFETVTEERQDPPGVLLDLPPEAYEDLDPVDRAEAVAAAAATFLERAREIRRRQSDR